MQARRKIDELTRVALLSPPQDVGLPSQAAGRSAAELESARSTNEQLSDELDEMKQSKSRIYFLEF